MIIMLIGCKTLLYPSGHASCSVQAGTPLFACNSDVRMRKGFWRFSEDRGRMVISCTVL